MSSLLQRNLANTPPEDLIPVIEYFSKWRDDERSVGYDGISRSEKWAREERDIAWGEFLNYLNINDHTSDGITVEILPAVLTSIKVEMGDNSDYERLLGIDRSKSKSQRRFRRIYRWIFSQHWPSYVTWLALLIILAISMQKIISSLGLKTEDGIPGLIVLSKIDWDFYVLFYLLWWILSLSSSIYFFLNQRSLTKSDRFFLAVVFIMHLGGLINNDFGQLFYTMAFVTSLFMVPAALYSFVNLILKSIYFKLYQQKKQ